MSPAPKRRQRPNLVVLAAGGIVALVAAVVVIGLLVSGDDTDAEAAAAFGPVTVEGDPLPEFVATDDDNAIAVDAPVVGGEDFDGEPSTIGGAGAPTMVAFLAHWCPHCQRELPILVELEASGELPDGLRTVAVITGTNEAAPNFPPADWLAREGWEGDVLLDDEETTAARAYGLAGYPFLVFLDANGRVVARTSGEIPAEAVTSYAEQAAAGG